MKKILIASLLTYSILAHAEDPPPVVNSCSFTGVTNGMLALELGTGNPNTLSGSSQRGQGQGGVVHFKHVGNMTLTITAPTMITRNEGDSPPVQNITLEAILNSSKAQITAYNGGSVTFNIPGSETEKLDRATLNLTATSSTGWPTGSYQTSATATCY